ncbi:MAG: alpha/beta fold hydrolase [Planctomycetota bacterium]
MNARTASLALSLSLLASPPSLASDLTIDLGRGPVTVFVPSSYDREVPMPLVVALHGYSASSTWMENFLQLTPVAESVGFLYARADGTVDGSNNRFWNATDACCDFFDAMPDDSRYLRALIEEIAARLAVDRRRIHLIGHSNGCFMSNRMACEHADLIASFVGFGGATWSDESLCANSEPVHMLHIHGTNDTWIDYDGGLIDSVTYPGAVETVETWAALNGCALVPEVSPTRLDLDTMVAGDETTVTRYVSACDLGGSAELWTLAGSGHVPILTPQANEFVVRWLFAHPKPGAGTNHCASTPNSTGSPAVMRGEGSSSIAAADLRLVAESLPRDQEALVFYGQDDAALPLGNGTLCVGSGGRGLFRFPVLDTGPSGRIEQPITYAGRESQLAVGSTWRFQAWFRDPVAGGSGFDLSNGLTVVFRP